MLLVSYVVLSLMFSGLKLHRHHFMPITKNKKAALLRLLFYE